MRARQAFVLSIALVLLALSLRLAALGQLQEGYRIRRESGQRDFPVAQSRSAAWLLYSSVPLAAASTVFLFVSFRRREHAWRWITACLLALYLLVSLAPA